MAVAFDAPQKPKYEQESRAAKKKKEESYVRKPPATKRDYQIGSEILEYTCIHLSVEPDMEVDVERQIKQTHTAKHRNNAYAKALNNN